MPSLSSILRMEQELKLCLREVFGRDAGDILLGEAVGTLNLTIPPAETLGDLSTNIILAVSKALGKKPRDLAKQAVKELSKRLDWPLNNIEVAGPGFLNFFFKDGFWQEVVNEIGKEKGEYGRNKLFSEKVQLEFVSANPTGPLNVVNARAAAVGDALSRAFSALGYQVTKEFYINDEGRQIKLLGESVLAAQKRLAGEEALPPDDGYHGEYITELARQLPKQDTTSAGKKAVEQIISWQKEVLAKYGVLFDKWYRQSELEGEGYLGKARQVLDNAGCTYQKDGAVWLRNTAFGDSADQVMVKSSGETTYYLADIAYHLRKHEQDYKLVIDILGPDHYGHISRMQSAMQALGYGKDWLEILIAQQVNIVRAGERVKMGKRVGEFITLDELIGEVGVDVAKYFFLERGLSSHMDFDFELAKKTSMENPVYYIQYAHARICSILGEGEQQSLAPQFNGTLEYPFNAEEIGLGRELLMYPRILLFVVLGRQPQLLCSFLHNLAGGFHRYYTKYRVLQAETKGAIQSRLNLVEAVRQVIANGLGILGISAPEKM
jgi:arginyl-tRNA synthetase